jgi:hypothetical protein
MKMMKKKKVKLWKFLVDLGLINHKEYKNFMIKNNLFINGK